jgi:hypothetical protein
MTGEYILVKSNNYSHNEIYLEKIIVSSKTSNISDFIIAPNMGNYLLIKINNMSLEIDSGVFYKYRFLLVKRSPKNSRKFILTYTNEMPDYYDLNK